MNKQIASHIKIAVLVAGLATFFTQMIACADNMNDAFTPSMASPAVHDDVSLLNRRLLTTKKDLEQFLIFAEYFTTNGDTKTVEQLQSPVDDFLKRHVDNLLAQGSEQVNFETTRISAEIMFIKTRLLLNLNQVETARGTVTEMKKRFGPYHKNTVQIAGKSTTLNEAIRLLDEELMKTANPKKK